MEDTFKLSTCHTLSNLLESFKCEIADLFLPEMSTKPYPRHPRGLVSVSGCEWVLHQIHCAWRAVK